MDDIVYDLCIVGAGMYGSAAARHASAYAGVKVCLVGPNEPTVDERATREIFGAHYDEGRISRILEERIPDQILAKHSMSRYRELEELSGIKFYQPVGFLYISKKNSSDLNETLKSSSIAKLPVVDLSHGDIFKKRFPFLKIKPDDHPILDDTGAGHISPRKIVTAQKKVAKEQGCHIVPEVVDEVKPLSAGIHEIVTQSGKVVRARRVLLCPGAFINMKKLSIPKLKITINKETVAFLKISTDEAKRLSSMPCIDYAREEENFGAYILPPIQYPNGHYYLKIGHLDFGRGQKVETLDEIKKWYLSDGDPSKIESLPKFLLDILPGLQYEEITSMTCVTCSNPTGQPYIDRVSPTVTVAAVGNGGGAAKSEEIGRIAAHLSLTGRWDSELDKSLFKIVRSDE